MCREFQMKYWIKIALACSLALTAAACNTVKGVGKDIKKAGEVIEDSVD